MNFIIFISCLSTSFLIAMEEINYSYSGTLNQPNHSYQMSRPTGVSSGILAEDSTKRILNEVKEELKTNPTLLVALVFKNYNTNFSVQARNDFIMNMRELLNNNLQIFNVDQKPNLWLTLLRTTERFVIVDNAPRIIQT